jgi:hypothetical protein
MIFAVDVAAAGKALRAGRLCCPSCGGVLRVWSPARTRRVGHVDGEQVELTPDRGLCRGCTATHVIVPAWYVPRRAYTVEVIGHALLGAVERTPYAALAEQLRAPVDTIKGWLRAARRSANALIRHAILSIPHTGRDRPDPRWSGDALAEALATLGHAAAAFARAAVPTPARPARIGFTGIDYLRLVAAQHHRELCRRLHVADPSRALAWARPWHLVNLITARRGLLPTPAP